MHLFSSLRRATCHPSLVKSVASSTEDNGDDDAKDARSTAENDSTLFTSSVLADLGASASLNQECPICLDIMDAPVLVPGCMHSGYGSLCMILLYAKVLIGWYQM